MRAEVAGNQGSIVPHTWETRRLVKALAKIQALGEAVTTLWRWRCGFPTCHDRIVGVARGSTAAQWLDFYARYSLGNPQIGNCQGLSANTIGPRGREAKELRQQRTVCTLETR